MANLTTTKYADFIYKIYIIKCEANLNFLRNALEEAKSRCAIFAMAESTKQFTPNIK